jgi:TPP-dependent pyruvate/acetoin dehydrogenase alpha subunit
MSARKRHTKASRPSAQPSRGTVRPQSTNGGARSGHARTPAYRHVPSGEELLRLYRIMQTARRLDERYLRLFRQGRFHGNVFPGVGEEAATCVPAALLRPQDWIMPSHREIGAAVAKGLTLREMTLHQFARLAGLDKGKSHPGHWGSIELHFVVGASTVAGQIPLATGVTWAAKIRGEDTVAMAFFGDGGTARGDFHEAMNFAGIHKLACVFVCKNNLWAESVPLRLNSPVARLADRAAGYGMPGVSVDGNDTLAMYDASMEAVLRARRGEGPTLIEAVTYRWYGHSAVDPANYRSAEEVATWKARDPLKRLEDHLVEARLATPEDFTRTIGEIDRAIDDAVEFAEKSPLAPPEEALTDVYAPPPGPRGEAR